MSARARALANLYRRNKVTKDGLKRAVADGLSRARNTGRSPEMSTNRHNKSRPCERQKKRKEVSS